MTRTITFQLSIRTKSETNLREHWGSRKRRREKQRKAACDATSAHSPGAGYEPTVVHLTRIAPRKFDSDNLSSSFKAIRDGMADAFAIDDGDERIEWKYGWRRGAPKEYAVDVEIVFVECPRCNRKGEK